MWVGEGVCFYMPLYIYVTANASPLKIVLRVDRISWRGAFGGSRTASTGKTRTLTVLTYISPTNVSRETPVGGLQNCQQVFWRNGEF